MQVIRNKLDELSQARLNKILKNPEKVRAIDSGATATIYPFGKKHVIRIQKDRNNFPAERYLPWLRHCLASRSKHVPKFLYAAYETNEDGGVTKIVTVLEKLQTVDKHFGWEVVECLDYAAGDVESYIMGEEPWTVRHNVKDIVPKAFPKRAAYSLRKSIGKKGINMNDLHGGNWMVRKSDGRLVITDPCA